MATIAGAKTRRTYFDCGVPVEFCVASVVPCDNTRGSYKAHGNYDSAYRCARAYARKRSEETGEIFLVSKPVLVKGGKEGRALAPTIRG